MIPISDANRDKQSATVLACALLLESLGITDKTRSAELIRDACLRASQLQKTLSSKGNN